MFAVAKNKLGMHKLHSSIKMSSLPRIQQKAPEFKTSALFPNKEFKDISLSDYLGKWVVFFLVPIGFYICMPD